MAAVLGVAAAVLLCLAGVTLIGCGGGGEETTPAPGPAPLKIVSQSFNCQKVVFATDAEKKVPDSGTYKLMIDMDQGRWRTDVSTTFKMSIPFSNISDDFTFEQSSMFSAATGRHTFSNHSIENVNGKLTLVKACIYAEPAAVKTAAELQTCLDARTALFKEEPNPSDPNMKRYQLGSKARPDGNVDGEYFLVDGTMVIKKMSIFEVVKHVNKAPTTVTQTMEDLQSVAGVPSADVFEIPAEWGSCTKVTIEALMALGTASGVPEFLGLCADLPPSGSPGSQSVAV